MLHIVIPGIPQQQGSKNPWGGDANKNLKPWRTSCALIAQTAMAEYDSLFAGPIMVQVVFTFPRPKSHYRTNGQLKESAPHWHTNKPDADKLQRALGDALTGVVIKDDSLICCWIVDKVYGEIPRTEVCITELREATEDDRRRIDPSVPGARAGGAVPGAPFGTLRGARSVSEG